MTLQILAPCLAVALLLLPAASQTHAAQAPAPAMADAGTTVDVRNGDQTGKLTVQDSEIAFVSLTDAKHSRNWKYADIREVSRKGRGLRIRPFSGSRYDFQFDGKPMREKMYGMISQKVLAARLAAKPKK